MNEREAASNPHPPSCTCVRCTERRLRRPKGLLARLAGIFKRGR